MGLLTKLQNRLELLRLEKRYTTRRKAGPTAQYVDGEYIYQTADSSSSNAHAIPQFTSSSSTYAASQHQHPPTSPTTVSFTSAPAPSSARTNPHHSSGIRTKRLSWHSLTASSFATSSARNSTLTAPDSPATSSSAISKNSRGQSWEPPKQGWGADGTDAFKEDKREFRFDVEKDRMSMGMVD
ncbi:hypothetical protein EPUS_05029 [Endocarpon pusillum Z07020]|uniref:Uncharacterized protein n=1 Tax=Endocarpon pusillum (strain Z07020 / HMAS-L-300199) TaxID=1263415 RepID=U1GL52_ENDPU|nr:uncharacterized protein EPUS_05029 [Endocarpon pusillum Z07020]ERF72948.1 hypothetical protein EPUS_05029 [Endocarpon pusillum Z07020]